MARFKLKDPGRAIVDDVELERDGEAQDLTPDQVDRLTAIGVELEPVTKAENKEQDNG